MKNPNKFKAWCFFDFGLSSFPTLILTFFYASYYTNVIARNELVGSSNWAFTISIASLSTLILLLFIIVKGRKSSLGSKFFNLFFYTFILSSFSLVFFGQDGNDIIPLILIYTGFIAFEILNLFYNISLNKVSKKKNIGYVSNIGWAFGYLGGLISLFLVWFSLSATAKNNYLIIYNINIFSLIGPLVAIWALVFCYPHLKNFSKTRFHVSKVREIFTTIISSKALNKFTLAYFFYNNAVICLFVFASIYAITILKFSEKEVIFLGIFINLSGFFGCLILGFLEDRVSSKINILGCLVSLFFLTIVLLVNENKTTFWIIGILIGFFIGPIQASSRAYFSLHLSSKLQLSAFAFYSILGNACSILGPLLIGIFIRQTGSLKLALTVIPIFFFIGFVTLTFRKPNA